jgi:hypothetical protein
MVVLKPHGMAKTDAQIVEGMMTIARIQTCYRRVYPETTTVNFTY